MDSSIDVLDNLQAVDERSNHLMALDRACFTNHLSFYIRFIGKFLNTKSNESLHDTLISTGVGKFTTLLLLSTHPGIKQKDLGRLLAKEPSSMVRLIDQLVSLGLVERRQNAIERRSYALYLTKPGEAEVEQYCKLAAIIDENFFNPLSVSEQGTMLTLLKKVYSHWADSLIETSAGEPASRNETVSMFFLKDQAGDRLVTEPPARKRAKAKTARTSPHALKGAGSRRTLSPAPRTRA